jgi:hypothetical protein
MIKVYIAGPYGKRAGATDLEQQVNMTQPAPAKTREIKDQIKELEERGIKF